MKRYYWLKLKEDFFSSKRIKKLRKIAGGDTYTIIYLKMQLLSIKTDGVLKYTGLESSFAEELALDLDEEPENVAVTLNYLASCDLIETSDNVYYLLPFVCENVGSEGASAQRVRDFRNRKETLPSADVTNALHCNTSVTDVKRLCNVEIEKEKEIDIDIDREEKPKRTRFVPPTVEEIKEYCDERRNSVNPNRFYDFYSSKGWMVGSNKMKDWKAAVRTWEQKDRSFKSQQPKRATSYDLDEIDRIALEGI